MLSVADNGCRRRYLRHAQPTSPLSEPWDVACAGVAGQTPNTDTAWMGRRNYLVEGVSGTGKTSVCDELVRRGYQAIHGDRELAYQGDPATGHPTGGASHEHHIWDVGRVRALASDPREAVTFFCGGSRNHHAFLDLFDEVFVLAVDRDTLRSRLDQRPQDEWGSQRSERELILRLHATQEDVPAAGVIVDATRSVDAVVDDILRRVGLDPSAEERTTSTLDERSSADPVNPAHGGL